MNKYCVYILFLPMLLGFSYSSGSYTIVDQLTLLIPKLQKLIAKLPPVKVAIESPAIQTLVDSLLIDIDESAQPTEIYRILLELTKQLPILPKREEERPQTDDEKQIRKDLLSKHSKIIKEINQEENSALMRIGYISQLKEAYSKAIERDRAEKDGDDDLPPPVPDRDDEDEERPLPTLPDEDEEPARTEDEQREWLRLRDEELAKDLEEGQSTEKNELSQEEKEYNEMLRLYDEELAQGGETTSTPPPPPPLPDSSKKEPYRKDDKKDESQEAKPQEKFEEERSVEEILKKALEDRRAAIDDEDDEDEQDQEDNQDWETDEYDPYNQFDR